MFRPGHYNARAYQYDLQRIKAVVAKVTAAAIMARVTSELSDLLNQEMLTRQYAFSNSGYNRER